MARDNTKARLQLQLALWAFDGTRPSGTLEWVSAAAPVVTQAAVGAGHWAAGRRQRALAAWAWARPSGAGASGRRLGGERGGEVQGDGAVGAGAGGQQAEVAGEAAVSGMARSVCRAWAAARVA
jgi:hypothetical protein